MPDIKWIKVVVDLFEDEKILLIDLEEDRDSILLIWFKLLCLAGKQNNDGVFMLNNIPLNSDMLAAIFHRPPEIVRRALVLFRSYGMITEKDGVLSLTNWDKHQSIAKTEKTREKTRQRVAKHRQNADVTHDVTHDVTLCNADVTHDVTLCNATEREEEEEREIEEDIDISSSIEDDIPRPRNDSVRDFVDSFNEICTALPRVLSVSESRKKKINARLKDMSGDIEACRKVFKRVQASEFLSGRSGKWTASFDWLICASNWTKVVEGNYDDAPETHGGQRYAPTFDITEIESVLDQEWIGDAARRGIIPGTEDSDE